MNNTQKLPFNPAIILMSIYTGLITITWILNLLTSGFAAYTTLDLLFNTFRCILLILLTIGLYMRKRTIIPFISLVLLTAINANLYLIVKLFDNEIPWDQVLKTIGLVILIFIVGFATFRGERMPVFFKKIWFVPAICLGIATIVALIVNIKTSDYSDFGKLLLNNYLPVAYSVVIVLASFFGAKWAVNSLTIPQESNSEQPTTDSEEQN